MRGAEEIMAVNTLSPRAQPKDKGCLLARQHALAILFPKAIGYKSTTEQSHLDTLRCIKTGSSALLLASLG